LTDITPASAETLSTLRTVAEVRAVLAQQRRASTQSATSAPGTASKPRTASGTTSAPGTASKPRTASGTTSAPGTAPTPDTAPTPRVGLVPTMGALHEGHLSLIQRARQECDVVVVSLFVNPIQFNDQSDLDGYPHDEDHDRQLVAAAGADILFAPSPTEMYPPGFATTVAVAGITEVLEGAERGAAHFNGVTTVVTKLLNIVRPDVAYFGEKDAQQGQVIRRLVADLNLDVKIELCPIVREVDGLARSSRNVHLHGDERGRATTLHATLAATAAAVDAGERNAAKLAADAQARLIAAGVEPDYFALVDPETFAAVDTIDHRPVRALVAARVGSTRLIDNQLLEPADVRSH
jgi:pantoate--beta-alanine ligase